MRTREWRSNGGNGGNGNNRGNRRRAVRVRPRVGRTPPHATGTAVDAGNVAVTLATRIGLAIVLDLARATWKVRRRVVDWLGLDPHLAST